MANQVADTSFSNDGTVDYYDITLVEGEHTIYYRASNVNDIDLISKRENEISKTDLWFKGNL